MDERRDDWRRGVDQTLVSLTTAQRVTDQQMDDLELQYAAIDKVLRGDPETDTDGFIARLHNLENAVQELKAERVKFMVADVTVKGFKWEFLTKVTVQLLILAGLLILGWDKVAELTRKLSRQVESPLEREIEQARHPKGKVHYKTRHVPAEVPLDESHSGDTEASPLNPPK